MTYEEENLARAAIRHTQSIYNNSADRGRVDEMVTAFASDGVLDTPGQAFTGHQEIAAFIKGVGNKSTTTVDLIGSRHHLTTSRVEFDGPEKAQGWTYFFVMRQGEVIQEGTYIDQYRREGDRWLIAHRRVKMLYSIA